MGVFGNRPGGAAILALVSLVAIACGSESAPPWVADLEVEVWSQVNGGKLTRKNKLVDFDDRVLLFALVEKDGARYSSCPEAIEAGVTRPLESLGVEFEFEWYKVVTERSLYCTKAGFEQFLDHSKLPRKMAWYFFDKLALDRPRYISSRFGDGGPGVPADVEPRFAPALRWSGEPVGTMRFKVVAAAGPHEIESPGERELESSSFARKDRVHRISVKADTGSDVLDVGFAHGNLPYFYGSASRRWEWYGSDCAKFVSAVYSRAVDRDFGYLGTGRLIGKRARSVINGVDSDGVYTWDGKRIEFGKHVLPGDIVVVNPSPHHAGLVGLDANGNGLLDREDPVLHTGAGAPEYEPIGDTSLGRPHARLKILKIRH